MGMKSLQHPDTHLPICLSAGRVSATLWIRSLGISLSETSQLVRTRSGQLAVSSNLKLDTHARVEGWPKTPLEAIYLVRLQQSYNN